MARNEKVFVAFVASPSDVEDERNKLEEVVQELNSTWGRNLSARLELIRWETHSYPGADQDAQAVINQQIGNEYDIFIGIMWGRFGSPTERAASGTEEEFHRVWQRHQDGSDVKIMFYFKDAPIAPSKLDPKQLAKIQSFKSKIGDEGVFHWSFQTLESFEGLLRVHLSRQLQAFQTTGDAGAKETLVARTDDAARPSEDDVGILDLKTTGAAGAKETLVARTDDAARPSEDDVGILDLMEVLDERFRTVAEIITRIGSATDDLATRMNQRTGEITKAIAGAEGGLSHSEAKKLVNTAADDMNRYVTRADAEIPILRETFRDGVRALGKVATLAADFNQGDLSKVKEDREIVTSLEILLANALEVILAFRHSIHSFPRMTTMLNKAKRKTLETLDELLQVFEDGRRDIKETGKVLDGILGEESRIPNRASSANVSQ